MTDSRVQMTEYRVQMTEGAGARFQVSGFRFHVPIYFVPLSQGAKRVFRGMTECHSVPSEGSTPQCDVGQSPQGGGGLPIMPPLTTLAFYRPLHPSGTSPNLGEESEGMTNGNVKGEAMK